MPRKIDLFAFLDRAREDPEVYPLEVRRSEFREIYKPYSQEEAAGQTERCLACGNPYCEWKCPVHNYIPNWLKLARDGRIMETMTASGGMVLYGTARTNRVDPMVSITGSLYTQEGKKVTTGRLVIKPRHFLQWNDHVVAPKTVYVPTPASGDFAFFLAPGPEYVVEFDADPTDEWTPISMKDALLAQ